YSAIENVEEKEFYELSPAQKRLYIQQQENPGSIAYNLPGFYIVSDDFDKEKFEAAFRELIKRHESLRTSFEMIEMNPVQRIYKNVEFEIEYFDIALDNAGEHEVTDRPAHLIRHFSRSFMRPFGLSRPPLFRVGLLEIEEKRLLLMVDMHHIIADGFSIQLLIGEFKALYKGFSLSELKVRYKDYSRWQNLRMTSGEIKRQEEYWLKEFGGEIPELRLPLDYKRGEQRSFKGSGLSFSLDGETEAKLRTLAKEEEVTQFIFLSAIYYIFLFKLSGQEDIVMGTVTAGRGHADLEKIIGMFVNTLALRNFPRPDRCFDEFLAEVKKRTLDAFENQDYQFEDLVEKLRPDCDAGRNPLFDVVFTFISQGTSPGAGELERGEKGLKISECKSEENNTMFDLVFGVFDWGGKIGFVMQYNTQLFKESTIERFAGYFKEIVRSVLANKNIRLGEIAVSHDLQAAQANVYKETQMDFEF
ncbi:MAG TPA: condensation domain-containing protein, partial [Candidatus Deferrimicrobium sp.]|nr:condensation domain-containing protein [Candidatus Deferrimicrobium sp.]